jgi:hypothetical protein
VYYLSGVWAVAFQFGNVFMAKLYTLGVAYCFGVVAFASDPLLERA